MPTEFTWSLPAIALGGTTLHVGTRREFLRTLERYRRVYLALDADEAGRAATGLLLMELGPRATAVPLPGVKDVAELAPRPGGLAAFRHAVRLATATAPEPAPLAA